IHAMYHATEGFLAATNELMSLHVDRATRRGAPMAPEILARLAAIQRVHDTLPRPPQAGRAIGLANKPTWGTFPRERRESMTPPPGRDASLAPGWLACTP